MRMLENWVPTDAYNNFLNEGLNCPDEAQHDDADDSIQGSIQRFLRNSPQDIFDRTQDKFKKYLTSAYEPVCPERTPEVDQNALSALLFAVVKQIVIQKASEILGAMVILAAAAHMSAIVNGQIWVTDYESEVPPSHHGLKITMPGL